MQKYKLQATGTPTPEFLNASRNIFLVGTKFYLLNTKLQTANYLSDFLYMKHNFLRKKIFEQQFS